MSDYRPAREVIVVREGGPKGDVGPRGPIGPVGPASTVPGPRGLQGIQGVIGPEGLSAYEVWLSLGNTGSEDDFFAGQAQDFHFTQLGASDFWVIVHPRRNTKPDVRVFDTIGMETEGDVEYPDAHTVTISFTVPMAGEAFLN